MNASSSENGSFSSRLTLYSDVSVLVVEDERLVAWDLEQQLCDLGAAIVHIAGSLLQARQLLVEHDYSLIILDLKLPDGSGEALAEEISKRMIPIIFLTGYSSFSHIKHPVLIKPFGSDVLAEAVMAALQNK